jgi:hypothetical protein
MKRVASGLPIVTKRSTRPPAACVELRSQKRANRDADAVPVAQVARGLVHLQAGRGLSKPASEQRQRVSDHMRNALQAPRPRRELAPILFRGRLLREQLLDAGEVERDIAVRAVEKMRPCDDHERFGVLFEPTRGSGPRPREPSEQHTQQLRLINLGPRLRLQPGHEDDAGVIDDALYSLLTIREENRSCAICTQWSGSATSSSRSISTVASSA